MQYEKYFIEIYKRLYSDVYHFKSDLIYNMDHMNISSTEPSSVILSQKRVILKVGSESFERRV